MTLKKKEKKKKRRRKRRRKEVGGRSFDFVCFAWETYIKKREIKWGGGGGGAEKEEIHNKKKEEKKDFCVFLFPRTLAVDAVGCV